MIDDAAIDNHIEALRLKLADQIATQLRETRAINGWSQMEAALRCNIDPKTYARFESQKDGNFRLTSLINIACRLGLDVDIVIMARPSATK